MELRGAVCLVTGASSGIGRASAERLARMGARVVGLGRDEDALAELVRRTGGRSVTADLGVGGEAARAAAAARGAFGRIDVLVNCAGQGWLGPFADQAPEGIERLVRVNLLGTLLLTRAVLPEMLERGAGRVVVVSSIAGHVGVREEATYAATKAGLNAFSESLRQELRGTGVTVTVVSPGAVDTPFFERRGRPYPRTHPRPVSVDRVARAVVAAARDGRPQLYVPRWVGLAAWVRGALPGAYRWGADRFG
jgi:short-subunit dehydrogenase